MTPAWAKGYGASGSEVAFAVAYSSYGTGRVCVTGRYLGTFSIGSYLLPGTGTHDIFVACFDSLSGGVLWAKGFGSLHDSGVTTSGQDWGKSIAVDGSGNVCITGFFTGSVDFGGTLLTSASSNAYSDIFLACFDSGGSTRWARAFGETISSSYNEGNAVAIDSKGNVVVTGSCSGNLDFGEPKTDTGKSWACGTRNLFVASFSSASSSTSTLKWANVYQGDAVGQALAIDANDYIHVSGEFKGSLVFDSNFSFTAKGDTDAFLARCYSDGDAHWVRSFGLSSEAGVNMISPRAVAAGKNNVFMAGYYIGYAYLGGSTFKSNGSTDIFIAGYEISTSAHSWSAGYGGTGGDVAHGLAVDKSDQLYVAGHFIGTLDFGAKQLGTSATNSQIFAASFDSGGKYRWAYDYGSTSATEYAYGVAVEAADTLYLAGYYTSSMSFGSHPLIHYGSDDIFLVRLVP